MNSISQKNLELFSKLSGDFNPLHLDQEFAKNSYYGDQVIYGIYQVFLTLENFFKKNQKNIKIQKIKASFICRRKNKISIWKNKTSIKVEILFFYKP
ncbi:hypothetical protein E2Z55_06085 [Campylobacter jejuni]|nr:hypothetical protein [Campylobacter jejuni]